MAIKVVPINGRLNLIDQDGTKNDCVVLRMYGKGSQIIDMSFPFHEDTQNFQLTIPEALELRNAIDQLIDIKLLEKPRGN